ncbi:uncharacterized protein LOC115922150 [Strongylocentrotus purpuratus]|uniref:Odorant receptor n=1 Tax=Strongylocentrotus purpuratus TaxID=7668 RepID=A0A7M7SWC0_STRPU|nr:uncharacterized protein LOC115922150 [Strongylocentrotus purpuratus]
MLIIVIGLSVLMIKAQLMRNRYEVRKLTEDYFMQPSLRDLASSFGGAEMAGLQEMREAATHAFLSLSDIDTIHSMELFFNRPLPLCRIALPALLSLAFCPLVLFVYPAVARFFWPPDQFPEGTPVINDAIVCFLIPAGLVYATSFGFSYQSAMEKQRSLISIVSGEVSKLDQIIVMTSHMTYITLKEKAMIYGYVKDEAITIIRQIQGVCKGSTDNYKGAICSGQIWRIVPILRNSGARQEKWHLDRHILDSLMDHVVGLNSDSAVRYEVMMTRIHPLKWLFLEALGFFAFFGVLLLDASSYRMELAMCIMTVFSITILCYVVADLDSPFNGFFRVNLSALPDIVDKASVFYEHAMEGKHVDGPADPGPAEHSINEDENVKKTSSHSINEVVIASYDAENTV